MNVPGDRREAKCRGRDCGAKILLIYSATGKWIPCEFLPSRVDGKRNLVFANGVVGKTYGDFEGGHETHFAYCKNADEFRKEKPPPAQASLGFQEPE